MNENIEKEVKSTKKATTKVVEEEVKDFDLVKENNELRKRLDDQSKQIAQLLEAIRIQSVNNSVQPSFTIQQPEIKKYKVINLTSDHNEMSIKSDKERYSLKGYLDFKLVTEDELRSIANRQRLFFRLGFLTTDTEGAKILEEKGINVINKWLSKKDLVDMDKLTEKEFTELYKSLHISQQERLVEEYVLKAESGENASYRDISKIGALNRLYKINNKLKERLQKLVLKVSEN